VIFHNIALLIYMLINWDRNHSHHSLMFSGTCFTMLTVFSTYLLDCWSIGLEVIWWKSYFFRKILKLNFNWIVAHYHKTCHLHNRCTRSVFQITYLIWLCNINKPTLIYFSWIIHNGMRFNWFWIFFRTIFHTGYIRLDPFWYTIAHSR